MAVNIVLRLAYDGTRYQGWARQPGRPTVQETLANALGRALGRMGDGPPRLVVAARTDAGVHALGQVTNFSARQEPDLARLRRSLDALLPPDLRVLDLLVGAEAFDARRSARGKRYRYHIFPGTPPSPFLQPFVAEFSPRLDFERMAEGAKELVGEIDMRAFAAHLEDRGPAPRRVHDASLTRHDSVWVFEVRADAFLHHAVRRMVGTLMWVGQGRLGPGEVAEIARTGARERAGPTVTARGLFLWEVFYDPELAPSWTDGSPSQLLRFPGV